MSTLAHTSVPDWCLAPTTPAVDPTGRRYTVITVGPDAAAVAENWLAGLGPLEPDAVRHLTADDTDAAVRALGPELANARVGWRLLAAGPAGACLALRAAALRAGVEDDSTLPCEPLRYIAGQVQEDVVLLDQRSDALWADAGVVTFAADWSFAFDVGMSFLEIHGPVPRIREEGIITRAHEFLKRLQPGRPYRRTNWTMTVGRRLDVSTERYHEWGPDREAVRHVDDETFGRLVHLRVEVQHLVRLPESGAIMFLIRTHLLPLEAIATVEAWRTRTAAVLAELPADMADYKGIAKYRERAAAWLAARGTDLAG